MRRKSFREDFEYQCIIGHRGSGMTDEKDYISKNPIIRENTIPSFNKAFTDGASWIEFDVQITSDKIPIIYHDFLYKETKIPIHKIKSSEWCRTPENTTLDRLFKECDSKMGFNIEIKYPTEEEITVLNLSGIIDIPEYVNKIFEVLEKYPERKIFVSSFHLGVLAYTREFYPNYPLFLISEKQFNVDDMNALQLAGVVMPYALAKDMILKTIKEKGLIVLIYDVNDKTFKCSWELGADGIIADDVLGAIASKNKKV
ncbi:Glycerophosphocholine phosphodiesterase GPCPD1 [Astathelohania contejeani]|uniref:Glycerophosphocholine phosphodiesterase GPCPD1 n=1 Tax=Astathelohania contejeani TaxID=164912 RepID=A0ABQ7HWB0_9MICR|nr:Glycerophosphocholine phosphodiesterase GPCPD1 [Thelohania contejeani]